MEVVSALVAKLRKRGFCLFVRDGKLVVTPGSQLTADEVDAIRTCREELIGVLEDERFAAVAERAYFDPPDFDASPVVMRESVILHLEGFPPVAVDPAGLEQISQWNAMVRKMAEDREKKGTTKKESKRPTGLSLKHHDKAE